MCIRGAQNWAGEPYLKAIGNCDKHISDWKIRLKTKVNQRSENRAKRFERRESDIIKLAVPLLGTFVNAALVNSAANRKVDWTEPCSASELQSARSRERFQPFHAALTKGRYSRSELKRLRQTVWRDLPLCRELVEFASLSLQLYNDLFLVDAVTEVADSVLDPNEHN